MEKYIMRNKRKYFNSMIILFCLLLLTGCNHKTENSLVEMESVVPSLESEEKTDEIHEGWKDAYKEIIRNMDSYLSDPYIERSSSESNVDSVIAHVGIHDFNNDNIPELIIGDLVSVGVFTFEDGIAKKIADLYEPEDWCFISSVYYKDNTIVLVNSGSDGSCYYQW